MRHLSILYRGPLSSCNYDCSYCPFAKHRESRAELDKDRRALQRFVEWCRRQDHLELSVLFTPWGEALIRPWYWSALRDLTHMPHCSRAVAQTNLSCRLDWVEECDGESLALWCTYHPSQVSRARFLKRCGELLSLGVRFSVGVVGLREHAEEIEALRRELPAEVYLWINAYKDDLHHYDADLIRRYTSVDPLFPVNNQRHPSRGRACRTGSSVISVDGDGVVRRCHFVREPLTRISDPDWELALFDRPCPNQTCGCHIGYVHMEELDLDPIFDGGILERIPRGW